MYDLIIRNARIIDGANNPWFRGDVAVKDGKILKVGAVGDVEAKSIVDAGDLYLAPGFIDIHTHSDGTIMHYPTAESRILQGITTEIGGACGLSQAPVNPVHKDLLADYLRDAYVEVSYDWESIGDFLKKVEEYTPSVNFGMVVGHGTIRTAVMGFDERLPNEDDLKKMRQYVVDAMEDGAFGLSSGLMYAPGIYSKPDEIAYLAEALLPYGGFYETHLRDENDKGMLIEAMEEAIEVCRRTKVPLQISHLKVSGESGWHKLSRAACDLIEKCREEGLDVTADQYAYSIAYTYVTSFMPDWSLEGGIEDMLQRLRNPESRSRIRAEVSESCKHLWDKMVLCCVGSDANAWVNGKTFTQAAEEINGDPVDVMLKILDEENGVCMVLELSMCEDDVEHIMKQRFIMIGSDGYSLTLDAAGDRHPRSFGSFARAIAHYCRERKLFPLETIIHKMTGMTAARLGLQDRGLIKEGMYADMVLFDFDKIQDTATFDAPKKGAEGIARVYVNGVLTAENGKHTGARAGAVLRKSKVHPA